MADRAPDSIALRDGSGADVACSYAELAASAAGAAGMLSQITPADPDLPRVALLLPHGRAVATGQLAAAALGWCYVPLDPAWPTARLRTMVELADPDAVLTHRSLLPLADQVAPAATPRLDLGSAGAAEFTPRRFDRTRPAYIMFTSGSTGRPKGVTHTHRSVLHGIDNHIRNFSLGGDDVVTLLSSFCFDMAVSDLYGGLLSGATVLTYDTPKAGPGNLRAALGAARPTVFHATPTVFRFLTDTGPVPEEAALPSVRMALLGGEPVHRQDVARAVRLFGPDTTLVNGYGSTEASFSVQRFIDLADRPTAGSDSGVLDIGHALHGYRASLDDPGPDGVGQILIHSEFLSEGYWRDPARTAERYSPDGCTYRTGDLARLLPDGSLEPAGRSDRQVKVNGVRVELDEVEDALETSPSITRGVAFIVPGTAGPELVAYAVSADGLATAQSMREHLKRLLPGAVIPQHLRVVDAIPLTLTGKADVLTLRGRHLAEQEELAAARTPDTDDPATAKILLCWSRTLGHPPAGLDAQFFESGGNSLLLARLQVEIQHAFGTRIALSDLMIHSTPAGMTHIVMTADTTHAPVEAVRRRQDAVAARMRRRSSRGR